MAQGKVYFPKNAPWVDHVINQLMAFPAGKNDDAVDVCSLFGRMLDNMFKAFVPRPEKIKPQYMTYDYIILEEEKPKRSKYRL